MKGLKVVYIAGFVVVVLLLMWIYYVTSESLFTVDAEELKEGTTPLGEKADITEIPTYFQPLELEELKRIITLEGDSFHPCEIACNVGNHIFDDFEENEIGVRDENARDIPLGGDKTYYLIKHGKFTVDEGDGELNNSEFNDLETKFDEYDCHMCAERIPLSTNYQKVPSLDEVSINLQLRDRKVDEGGLYEADLCNDDGFFINGEGSAVYFSNYDCKYSEVWSTPEEGNWNEHCEEGDDDPGFCDNGDNTDRIVWMADSGEGQEYLSAYEVGDVYIDAYSGHGLFIDNKKEVVDGFDYVYGLIWDGNPDDDNKKYYTLFMRTPNTGGRSWGFGGVESFFAQDPNTTMKDRDVIRYNPLGYWIPEAKRIYYKEVLLDNDVPILTALEDIAGPEYDEMVDDLRCTPNECPLGKEILLDTSGYFYSFEDMINKFAADASSILKIRISSDIGSLNGCFTANTYYMVSTHNWLGWYYDSGRFYAERADQTINIYKAPPLIAINDNKQGPFTLPSGGSVDIKGYNFPIVSEGYDVTISFDGEELASLKADSTTGYFETTVVLPIRPSGEYILSAGLASHDVSLIGECVQYCSDGIEYRPGPGASWPNCNYQQERCINYQVPNIGCSGDGINCDRGIECDPATATCKICWTGSCVWETNYDGGCYPKWAVPQILDQSMTCSCGITHHATVVSHCDYCDSASHDGHGTGCPSYNSGCEGHEDSDGGCSLANCYPSDGCLYDSQRGPY